MQFRIIGPVRQARTFAFGSAIREIGRLRRIYGQGKWRKRKGVALVVLQDGMTRQAKLHWYEAKGIGRKEYKIKRFVD